MNFGVAGDDRPPKISISTDRWEVRAGESLTAQVTDPAGTRYTYEQREGLIEIRDVHGNRVSFTESAITHSTGAEIRLTRDGAGRVIRIVAPDGQTWRYAYDDRGDLVQVTYPGDIVANLGCAATRPHFLETINDPLRGPGLRAEYDANGRAVAVIDAQGNRWEQAWEPKWRASISRPPLKPAVAPCARRNPAPCGPSLRRSLRMRFESAN